jgi:hypothetical protein
MQRLKHTLFGRPVTQERRPEDVDALVMNCPSKDAIQQLLSFGEKLLNAHEDRVSTIERKSATLVGYSTAILAFLATRNVPTVGSMSQAVLLVAGGSFAIAACVSAGVALHGGRNWQAMGEHTWFPADPHVVADADALGRWYLRAMHQSLQANHRIADQQAAAMVRAQMWTAAAGVCLGLLLVAEPAARLLSRLALFVHDVQGLTRIAVVLLRGV